MTKYEILGRVYDAVLDTNYDFFKRIFSDYSAEDKEKAKSILDSARNSIQKELEKAGKKKEENQALIDRMVEMLEIDARSSKSLADGCNASVQKICWIVRNNPDVFERVPVEGGGTVIRLV